MRHFPTLSLVAFTSMFKVFKQSSSFATDVWEEICKSADTNGWTLWVFLRSVLGNMIFFTWVIFHINPSRAPFNETGQPLLVCRQIFIYRLILENKHAPPPTVQHSKMWDRYWTQLHKCLQLTWLFWHQLS